MRLGRNTIAWANKQLLVQNTQITLVMVAHTWYLGLSCWINREPMGNTAQEITGPQASQIEQWVAQNITADE
jgi:hypothetical protein